MPPSCWSDFRTAGSWGRLARVGGAEARVGGAEARIGGGKRGIVREIVWHSETIVGSIVNSWGSRLTTARIVGTWFGKITKSNRHRQTTFVKNNGVR